MKHVCSTFFAPPCTYVVTDPVLHVQVSWLAVGCYYLMSGKQELARRYLSKSTSLNRVFGPAWLAYGHSFAAENEHDQAMAAYFTASQLMKGRVYSNVSFCQWTTKCIRFQQYNRYHRKSYVRFPTMCGLTVVETVACAGIHSR